MKKNKNIGLFSECSHLVSHLVSLHRLSSQIKDKDDEVQKLQNKEKKLQEDLKEKKSEVYIQSILFLFPHPTDLCSHI